MPSEAGKNSHPGATVRCHAGGMSAINVAELTPRDREQIRAALGAACEGPFFADWEFQTLMGVTRAELANVLAWWADSSGTRLDEPDSDLQATAIRNVLLNLVGYPLSEREIWVLEADWDVDRGSVADLLARL